MHAHFPRNMRQNFMARFELYSKHGIRQRLHHRALYFDCVLFGQTSSLLVFHVQHTAPLQGAGQYHGERTVASSLFVFEDY